MRRRLIAFAKYQRQLMWPRRPSTFEVLHTTFIIFVNGFCLVVSGFFIGLLWWCSTMSIGWIWIWWLWRWENKFCNLETLCCDFDERIVLFCFFSWWCVIYDFGYACMCVWVVKNLDAMGNPLWEVYFGFSSMCCLECHLQLCYLLDLRLLD